jgi:nicotinate-nucleotide adenylyltransferase
MRGFPRAYAGQRIGLFGGSFDPAHAGHSHVAETARKRLGLDAVWWLVTPQNPLKAKSAPLATRMAGARTSAPGPRHKVVDLETRMATQFTVDTLEALQRRYPGVRFVFVMGADGMAGFTRWRRWRRLLALAPVFVVSRPTVPIRARFAKPFAPCRRRPADRALPLATPPAFGYQPARLHPLSSTALRSTERSA